MSTRTLRNGMTWVMAGALIAVAAPAQAETDPTPGTRVVRVGTERSGMAAAGGGAYSPGSAAALFSPGPGLEIGPSAPVAGDASNPVPAPEAVGPRVRARIVGSWQPRITTGARSGSSLQRNPKLCDALCAFFSGHRGEGAADVARLKQLVTRVTAGYGLSSTLRVSLTPRVQRVRGQPMTGFSVRLKGV